MVRLVRVPQAAPEHPDPESDQVTPLFCESFWMVAVKPADWEIWTEAEAGLTEMEIGGAAEVMVTEAEADLVTSDTEVAVIVTTAGVGTEDGAV